MGTSKTLPNLDLRALRIAEDTIWYLASSGEILYTEENIRRAVGTLCATGPDVDEAADVLCKVLQCIEALDRRMRDEEG